MQNNQWIIVGDQLPIKSPIELKDDSNFINQHVWEGKCFVMEAVSQTPASNISLKPVSSLFISLKAALKLGQKKQKVEELTFFVLKCATTHFKTKTNDTILRIQNAAD